MVDFNKILPLARIGVFGAVSFMSLIVLALSAHLISVTSGSYGYYYGFTALGIATAILSLATLPAMYWIALNRRGAFPAFIAVEIAWLWFLWIMWVAVGGSASNLWGLNHCRSGLCAEAQVVQAFGFLSWLLLMGYGCTVLVLSVIAHTRGHPEVWKSEVNTFDWNAPNIQGAVGKQFTMGTPVQTPGATAQVAQYPAATGQAVGQPAYPVQTPSPQPTGTATYVGAPVTQQYQTTPQV